MNETAEKTAKQSKDVIDKQDVRIQELTKRKEQQLAKTLQFTTDLAEIKQQRDTLLAEVVSNRDFISTQFKMFEGPIEKLRFQIMSLHKHHDVLSNQVAQYESRAYEVTIEDLKTRLNLTQEQLNASTANAEQLGKELVESQKELRVHILKEKSVQERTEKNAEELSFIKKREELLHAEDEIRKKQHADQEAKLRAEREQFRKVKAESMAESALKQARIDKQLDETTNRFNKLEKELKEAEARADKSEAALRV